MMDSEIGLQMRKHKVKQEHMNKIRLLMNEQILKMMKKKAYKDTRSEKTQMTVLIPK